MFELLKHVDVMNSEFSESAPPRPAPPLLTFWNKVQTSLAVTFVKFAGHVVRNCVTSCFLPRGFTFTERLPASGSCTDEVQLTT